MQSILVDEIGKLVYWYQYQKDGIRESGYGILLDIHPNSQICSVLVGGESIYSIPVRDIEIVEEENENSKWIISKKER